MKTLLRVGLVGDYNPDVLAHVAIPRALAYAAEAASCQVAPDWLATDMLAQGSAPANATRLAAYDALWCVPASPYASMDGALCAIRFARERGVPFLGTCGGFQHALIEYARNVVGLAEADHAESHPDATLRLITPLQCSLRGERGLIRLVAGTRTALSYGRLDAVEEYNCSFGLNPAYEAALTAAGRLRVAGRDAAGALRVVELAEHPFYVATLFQPERAALAGVAHPLINAYVRAAATVVRERVPA